MVEPTQASSSVRLEVTEENLPVIADHRTWCDAEVTPHAFSAFLLSEIHIPPPPQPFFPTLLHFQKFSTPRAMRFQCLKSSDGFYIAEDNIKGLNKS